MRRAHRRVHAVGWVLLLPALALGLYFLARAVGVFAGSPAALPAAERGGPVDGAVDGVGVEP